jgi:hypothetical protein
MGATPSVHWGDAMSTTNLPPGFEALEQFTADWVLPDAVARMHKRQTSAIRDIKNFYDAMLPHGVAALDYLKQFAPGALPPEGERLLKLMLALAEIAPAVEWYNGPQVTDGFPVQRIRYLRQIPDNAPQL